ncbi:FecR family protein [Rufibacter sediminis]|uniref:FecR domain-containing protein n=1 Tax=Rufibacter sediminis TaxID=2762756 RepID=A0ABR6VYT8_9BACT|nr:FecR domain-containing protein [Rufibacter sediminis]MBC3542326.1 FecR domain-containing protein [Rufibacter sediminis]
MTQTKLDTHENPEWVLMAKALRGELSEEEQLEFSAWLNEDDAHTQQWTDALEVWDEVGSQQNLTFQPDADLAWTKFCAKADFTPETKVIPLIPTQEPFVSEQPSSAVKRQIFPWNTFYKYVAGLVVAVGLAWLVYLQFNTSTSSAWTQVATAAGQRQLIYLPDSSQVTLNENSTLRYHTAFTGAERQVELVGEGFFEVRKNPKQPFIVKSGNAETRVLGTSFNVRALKGEPEVAVAVMTGKVAFTSLKNNQKVLLTPGYTGFLSANGQLDTKETEKATPVTWRSLEFNNTSLTAVADQLEKYFNVAVEVPNQKLQACTFTGTFENPELKEILTVLQASADLKINQSATGSYTIEGAGCQ